MSFQYNCPSYNSRQALFELITRENLNMRRVQWNTTARLLIHSKSSDFNNNPAPDRARSMFTMGGPTSTKTNTGIHYDENNVRKTFLNTPSNGLPFPSLHDNYSANEINDLKRMICVGIFNIPASSCGVPGVSSSDKWNGMKNEPIKIDATQQYVILEKIRYICEKHKKDKIEIREPDNTIPFSSEQFEILRSVATEDGIKDYLKLTIGLKKENIDNKKLKKFISIENTECILPPKKKKMKYQNPYVQK